MRFIEDFRYGSTGGYEILRDLGDMAASASQKGLVLTHETLVGAISLIQAMGHTLDKNTPAAEKVEGICSPRDLKPKVTQVQRRERKIPFEP